MNIIFFIRLRIGFGEVSGKILPALSEDNYF